MNTEFDFDKTWTDGRQPWEQRKRKRSVPPLVKNSSYVPIQILDKKYKVKGKKIEPDRLSVLKNRNPELVREIRKEAERFKKKFILIPNYQNSQKHVNILV